MRYSRFLQVAMPVLLGITLALPRVDAAHLHLCLDGQETPVALHSPDGGDHHTVSEAGSAHQDFDVDLSNNPLGKSTAKSLDSVLPSAASLFVLTANSASDLQIVFDYVPAISSRRYLLPPLRGPPI